MSDLVSIRAKPFIPVFFIIYLIAIPASLLCYLGFGRLSQMGSPIWSADGYGNQVSIFELSSRSASLQVDRDYFESSDGFIAFNLSKSVIHTLNAYPLESSDTLYSGLSNPIIDQIFGPENTTYSNLYVSEYPIFDSSTNEEMYHDVLSRWTVAPIFQTSDPCLEGYAPIHVTCMVSNTILGWALSTDSNSFCRSIHSSACDLEGQTDYRLSVYYPLNFSSYTPTSVGVSGIVSSTPPEYIVEAIKRRFVADGWPIDVDSANYPSGMPSLWMQPIPDITTKMEAVRFSFNVFKYISIFLISLAVVVAILPFVLDLQTDLLVKQMIISQREVLQAVNDEAMKREERRRQVEAAYELNFD